jgi:hypothetical protein
LTDGLENTYIAATTKQRAGKPSVTGSAAAAGTTSAAEELAAAR